MREKLNDWDINPNNYLKDENNNFILKKMELQRKKQEDQQVPHLKIN